MSSTPSSESKPGNEPRLRYIPPCKLPTPWAEFQLHAFVEEGSGKEHLAMTLGDVGNGEPVLVRLHSECLTGDALYSLRCDCGAQLEAGLQRIAQAGRGVLFYLRQEGRGIGLANKILAYRLQESGHDTVEANQELGFAPDQRNYQLCAPMFRQLGIGAVRLMTNNPRKVAALEQLGITVTERLPHVVERNPHNERYLRTKAAKLGHLIQP